jgi:hypothetical protein
MSTVIISHKVKDYAKWRPIFDADLPRRQGAGLKNEKVFRAADDPNNIFIQSEVANPEQAAKMLNDPDLEAKMEQAGVITKPTVIVLNPA